MCPNGFLESKHGLLCAERGETILGRLHTVVGKTTLCKWITTLMCRKRAHMLHNRRPQPHSTAVGDPFRSQPPLSQLKLRYVPPTDLALQWNEHKVSSLRRCPEICFEQSQTARVIVHFSTVLYYRCTNMLSSAHPFINCRENRPHGDRPSFQPCEGA